MDGASSSGPPLCAQGTWTVEFAAAGSRHTFNAGLLPADLGRGPADNLHASATELLEEAAVRDWSAQRLAGILGPQDQASQ
jgi:hypothetical protein